MDERPAEWDVERSELLGRRISDLGLEIEGTRVERLVERLYTELAERGVTFRPPVYLSDQWGCPDGTPLIGVPFYLADIRLERIEAEQAGAVESDEEAMRYLRHEAGHAVNYAFRLYDRADFSNNFGDYARPYHERYAADPLSRAYVRHILGWYAQKHPDEDFAETFAVWLTDVPEVWRQRYKGTNALKKLEYVERLMQEIKGAKPLVTGGRHWSDARKSRKTLARYYAERRKLFAEDFPDFYDRDLRAIFGSGTPGDEPAAKMMRRHRAALIASLVKWTGQRKYTVDMLVNRLMKRCQTLKLRAPRDSARLLFDLTAYLAGMVTNHLYTGKFKRSV